MGSFVSKSPSSVQCHKAFGRMLSVGIVILTLAFTACQSGVPVPTSTSTPKTTSIPTATATPDTASAPAPQVKFPGFDFQLSPGAFWEYTWEDKNSTFCRDCRGGPTIASGTFILTLGPPKVIQGVTAYELELAGKHKLESSSTERSFAPRWRYIAVADNRMLVSKDGINLVVLFDGQDGEWPGSGFLTTRFKATDLFDGKASGQDVMVSASSKEGGCKYYPNIGNVCPGGTATDYTESEVYRPGIGPVGYSFRYSFSSGSGTSSFSSSTSEKVELVASSLRGDMASSLDEGSDSEGLEIEPNDSLEQAPHLSLPAMIKGDTFQSDSRAELRFYDPEVEQWRFVALHDIYRFTVSEQRPVTITLSSEGGTSADLNLLLITPSEANNVDPVYIDGQELELVKLSTKNDPVETITTMLTPGDYFVGMQAFLTRARTDYILTIE